MMQGTARGLDGLQWLPAEHLGRLPACMRLWVRRFAVTRRAAPPLVRESFLPAIGRT